MFDIRDILVENPVVAAIRDETKLEDVIRSRVKIVFVLCGSILNIAETCKRLNDADKIVYIHVDMLEGLKGDMAGIEFLKKGACCEGILTTKSNVVRVAKQLGLHTILRVFILDSLSLKTGIKNVNEAGPDAVEIMPGVACKVIADLEKKISVPVIAGGLIVNREQVMESLSAGAVAISTASQALWDL
ncbi:MAG: glycerol-3-phosphate responsive antiterminator [Clostridia bacterium]|nr:glycerol-3-phosphate responsive antiterminator [Clostridia bacterium]